MRFTNRFIRLLYYWLPPIAWMAFIFFLSSRRSVGVTQTYLYDFIIFKSLHVIEYAILFLLLFRALHSIKMRLDLRYVIAVAVSILYGASDEIHQLMTPTRTGRIRDIFIDTGGIILMYIVVRKFYRYIKKLL